MSPSAKSAIAVTVVGALFILTTISLFIEWHSSSEQYTKIFGAVHENIRLSNLRSSGALPPAWMDEAQEEVKPRAISSG
jgi:hypothetical protein